MTVPHWSTAVALIVAIAGCDTAVDSGGGVDAGPSPECLEATEHSDLQWIQDNIFDRSCANFNACHKGAALSAGGLNLEEGMAEANLTNVVSDLFPEFVLVAPGVPEDSYMLIILGHLEGPIEPDVGTMPFNSDTLCPQKLEAIERWIESL